MLLFRVHTLPSGLRVRVRLPHRGDTAGLVALHERLDAPLSQLEARRLLRFDPRARAVVVATAWIDGCEEFVGYASGTVDEGLLTVLADEARAPGVSATLRGGLRERLLGVA